MLTGSHLYDCSKIIVQYLQPLANEYIMNHENIISDTLAFPDILRKNPLHSNEEYVSYVVDPLFTCIPLAETIKICVQKKLEPFCKKSVFKKLSNELSKGCTFLADGRLIRQVDGCPMGGPISVVLSKILCKNEI